MFNFNCQSRVKKSAIKDFTFHDFRHIFAFASQLVMAGVDLRTVQELLGHKTISMIFRYAHLSEADKKEAIKLLEINFIKIYRILVTVKIMSFKVFIFQ
ncbi:MAG: tyrosine-type recombinase/integrase [Thermodesulfovibrionales bacterium]|nr:tyrosine-type recombinase/integrase [Thermodesulfovibrionales bacterium]